MAADLSTWRAREPVSVWRGGSELVTCKALQAPRASAECPTWKRRRSLNTAQRRKRGRRSAHAAIARVAMLGEASPVRFYRNEDLVFVHEDNAQDGRLSDKRSGHQVATGSNLLPEPD